MNLQKPKIGVYICHCGMNIYPKVDVLKVAEYARKLTHVSVSHEYKFMCSNPGQELIIEDIKKRGLNRVVVASCSPRMHEPTFRKAVETAGLNRFCFQMANIREHASWVTLDSEQATKKAMELVAAAVKRVSFHAPLFTKDVPVQKSVLIIGGGIAGMQSALTAAEAGFKVHLVERETYIGGHMAKFDKTFPTLDCAACISTPKTVSIGQHPEITLHSYSEVTSLSGFVGNYKATIKKKPRYINEDTCTGCGLCAEKCPVSVSDPFNENLNKRKAVYRSFPQAIPLTFCIEKKDRAPCSSECPAGINIQGYIKLSEHKKYSDAISLIMEKVPLPGVLGRVCPNPCENSCRRKEVDSPVNIREIKRFASDHTDYDQLAVFSQDDSEKSNIKVAVIGSGPAGLTAAFYLRKTGYQVKIFEALEKPGGMLKVGIPDYRLPPETLNMEIGYIEKQGIEIETEKKLGRDFQLENLKQEGYSAVFLGIGAHLGMMLNIPGEEQAEGVLDAITYLRNTNLNKKQEIGRNVVIIGGGNVAIDTAGIAVRSGAETVSILYRRSREEMPAYDEEIEAALDEGVNLTCYITPMEIITDDKNKVVGIRCLKNRPGSVDESGRRRPLPIEGSEFKIACDTIIPAIGQKTENPFTGSVTESETALIFNDRGRIIVNTDTMQTPIPYIFAAGDAESGPKTVIDAIAKAHQAAIYMDRYLSGEDLSEIPELKENNTSDKDWMTIPHDHSRNKREESLLIPALSRVSDFREIATGLSEKQAESESGRCLNCGLCCECMECVKACEVKAIDHTMKEEILEIEAGAVILSTGFKSFQAEKVYQYGYGIYPEVYTSLEFERLNNATGPTSGQILMKNGETPNRVAIIHCVGSRDSRNNAYCSRVCCMYSMKFAHLVREKTGAEVWEYYIDMRSPGKLYEEFYTRVQEEGVHFVRGRVAEITDITDNPDDEGRLTVIAENTLTRKTLRTPVDMIILSVGLEAADGADDIGRMAGVSRDGDGWFNELHAKLAPVSTPISGIFLAGCCQGPKDIPDTVAQASGAAGEAISLLSKGTVSTKAEISFIDPELCAGCKTCIEVCAYSAIDFDGSRDVSVVNETLCQGCGSCSAACPASAAGVKQFTDLQLMNEIEGFL